MPTRTPDEIRASIEQNRQELGEAMVALRGEVVRITDWRGQLQRHRQPAMIAAAVSGFVLGGGLAGVTALVSGGARGSSAKGGRRRGKS